MARKEATEHIDRGRYAEADKTLMSVLENAYYAYEHRPSAALSRAMRRKSR
ncbi:MAG: hypothetical protein QUS14_04220 [Pyrinomonadaceae bacterium]|nr:hypothetical protein [Pyrinomonadaceae bacterium]